MKISRTWLQSFFDTPLPEVAVLSDALTFHAFEIESADQDMMDVKVLPDRAGYALSHRGIAKEISAILNIPIKTDPLRTPMPGFPATTGKLTVFTDKLYVNRHIGALIEGVKVGPSPEWLRMSLEAVGQRSINNVVDATNFVMLHIGQPSHAFDAGKISRDNGVLNIDIRGAREGEKVKILTGEELTLSRSMYVIADAKSGDALDIAGVKGGLASGITNETTSLFISVGNYDGTLIRKMSQALKVFTDASQRFQNRPSPELAAYGITYLFALLSESTGGKVIDVVDVYNKKPEQKTVTISAKKVSEILGAPYSDADLEGVFKRLDLGFVKEGDSFVVTPPFERTDLVIPEDLAEEVGRIIGYERVEPKEFPPVTNIPFSDGRTRMEAVRELLVAEGYNEISTYSMLEKGDVELVKPLADDKKYLRTNLAEGHKKAATLNSTNLPLFDVSDLRMFEFGHVWPKGNEQFVVGITYWINGSGAEKKVKDELTRMTKKLEELLGKVPVGVQTGNTLEFDLHELTKTEAVPALTMTQKTLSAFKPFSVYPFVLRDIAVWVSRDVADSMIYHTIHEQAGALLFRCDLFDTFEKGDMKSYAFRLVFQSTERTLSDAEVGVIMEKITAALNAKDGWNVR